MSYKPLKKTVRFSEEVRSNPSFPYVKTILKACGDNRFKKWLLNYIELCNSSDDDYELLISIKKSLHELVTREVNLDEDTLAYCKKAFEPVLNVAVVKLFEQALTFFCGLQQMEKSIQKISEDFANGNTDFTKDNKLSAQNALPRNAKKNGIVYK